jgi:hypothetical protein
MDPPTGFVETENIALVDPAGTVMLAGRTIGSPADSDTAAPPAGAAALRIAVTVTALPPTTLDALSEIEASAKTGFAMTVSGSDCLDVPLSDAVMAAVPVDTAVTVIVALDEPARTRTGVATVATAGLLLDNEMLEPPVGAGAVRLTVPSTMLPAATLVAPSATLDTAGVAVEGTVGEPELPQRIVTPAVIRINTSAANGLAR